MSALDQPWYAPEVEFLRQQLQKARAEHHEAANMYAARTQELNVMRADLDSARRLRSVLRQVRWIGATSGTNVNAWNEAFDLINHALGAANSDADSAESAADPTGVKELTALLARIDHMRYVPADTPTGRWLAAATRRAPTSADQGDQPNQSVNMRSSEDPYDKAARRDQSVTITQADVVTIEMPRTLVPLSGDTISLRWRGRVVSVDGAVTLTTAAPVVAGAVVMWTLDGPDVESDYELTPNSAGRWRLQVPIEPGEPVAVVLRGREQPRDRPVSE